MTLLFIVLACLTAGLLSLGLALLLVRPLAERLTLPLLAFATGVMLSSACLHMLPEALGLFDLPHLGQAHGHDTHNSHLHPLFMTLLLGLILFHALDRLVLRHTHSVHGSDRLASPPPVGSQSAAVLSLVGDSIHNFVDGVVIAAAFLVDPALGVSTTLAIIAHELPQEMGDFALFLCAGWPWRKAVLANVVASLSAVVGGLLGYGFLAHAQSALPFALTLAAASFIHIALSDLLPLLRQAPATRFVPQAIGVALGVAVMPAVGLLAG